MSRYFCISAFVVVPKKVERKPLAAAWTELPENRLPKSNGAKQKTARGLFAVLDEDNSGTLKLSEFEALIAVSACMDTSLCM